MLKFIRLTLISFGLVLVWSSSVFAVADVCTWTGNGDGSSWSDGTNWNGCDNGGVPENGDSLLFNATASTFTTNNDLAINVVNMNTTGSASYTHAGNPLTVTGEFIVSGNNHTIDFAQLFFFATAQSLTTLGGDHVIQSPIQLLSIPFMTYSLSGGGSIALVGGVTGSVDILSITQNGTLHTSSANDSTLTVTDYIQVPHSATVNCFRAQCLADPSSEVRLHQDGRLHFQAFVTYPFPIAVLNHNDSTAISNNSSAIILTGGISGDGDVIFDIGNGGVITFSGANANTFAGDMILNGGPDGLVSFFNGAQRVPNDLIVNDDILVLEAGGGSVDLVSDTSVIHLNHADSAFWLGTNTVETIAGITGVGTLMFNDGAELTLDQSDDRVFDGVIEQTALGSGFLTKTGAGRLDLTGSCDNQGTDISLVAEDGILAVDSANFSDCLFILDTGELRVNGTIGEVIKSPGAGAVFAPGLSPGTATIDGDFNIINATYVVEIEGLTAGTQYDQTIVNGHVNLGNTVLDVQRLSSFMPSVGNVFTIITFTGNLTGTFGGLMNNSQFAVAGVTYRINYNANDVTLTVVAVPSTGGSGSGSGGGGGSAAAGGCVHISCFSETQTTAQPDTTPTTTDSCAGYSDVTANDPDCAAFEFVQSLGAMTGHDDGTFRPEEMLQRDQIAKISLEAFDLFDPAVNYCNGSNPFPDVTPQDWSYQYVCRGKQFGMITGYKAGDNAGLFVPGNKVLLVEFWALILRNLDEVMPAGFSFSGFEVNAWYSGYAKYVADYDLHDGASPAPAELVPRRDVAKFLYDLHLIGKI